VCVCVCVRVTAKIIIIPHRNTTALLYIQEIHTTIASNSKYCKLSKILAIPISSSGVGISGNDHMCRAIFVGQINGA
jgi:hypothetical protein